PEHARESGLRPDRREIDAPIAEPVGIHQASHQPEGKILAIDRMRREERPAVSICMVQKLLNLIAA
ncbi:MULTISPECIES: hypothetical protein, partial [unclassified Mesorhizobium]|uniref:hypothetical protein n=1 Tax=unclassified Mesorhizobium TaxID=325217 RepID=UPI001AEC6E4F